MGLRYWLRVPLKELVFVRLQRPIVGDPEGYIVVVGETPADQRTNAILFLAVFALVAANAVGLAVALRRRRSRHV